MNGSESGTRTYRGKTLEEVLPQIRAELGPDAVITRRREGVSGGFGGFFGKRCVEVEARAAAPVAVVPPRAVFDAYDGGNPRDGLNPVIQQVIDQASPFATELDLADARLGAARPRILESRDPIEPDQQQVDLPELAIESIDSQPAGEEWNAAAAQLEQLGMPTAVVASLVRDARRTMLPFHQGAAAVELVRAAIARQVRIEHGWRTKRRTLALVGAAGSGKTLTAAKLCHAYAGGSTLEVRTLSLEPASAAYRLGALTEDLDIGLRVADTPESAAKAAARMPGESLIVVDTPAVNPRDADGIEALARMLEAVRPDETHLMVPATNDARATAGLLDALKPHIQVTRLVITRIDEVESTAVAVGSSFTHRKALSYVTDGRRPGSGLRPAEASEIAGLVLP